MVTLGQPSVDEPEPDRWRRSVVRRSALFLCVLAPGFVFNFGLSVAAAALLDAATFGVFYLAITACAVLGAPSIIVSFYCARQVARIADENGETAAWGAVPGMLAILMRWSGIAALVMLAALAGLGSAIGISSPALVALIAIVVWLTFVTDGARGVLQGLQRFLGLGVFTTSWMAARFVFGGAGLLLLGTAWGGLAGVALAGLVVIVVFRRIVPTFAPLKPAVRTAASIPLPSALLFGADYGLTMMACHLDVLVAYFILERAELGVYAASAVLPKALLALTLPVLQVAFTVAISEHGRRALSAATVLRSILATVVVCVCGAVLFALASDVLCGAPYGVRLCRIPTMETMLVAILPLCVLRALVVLQLAQDRGWQGLILVPPAAVFTVWAVTGDITGDGLADAYLGFGGVTLAFYALVIAVLRARG